MDNAISVQFIRELERPFNKQGGMLSLNYISSIVQSQFITFWNRALQFLSDKRLFLLLFDW